MKAIQIQLDRQPFYVTGGTLSRDALSYVTRQADHRDLNNDFQRSRQSTARSKNDPKQRRNHVFIVLLRRADNSSGKLRPEN